MCWPANKDNVINPIFLLFFNCTQLSVLFNYIPDLWAAAISSQPFIVNKKKVHLQERFILNHL